MTPTEEAGTNDGSRTPEREKEIALRALLRDLGSALVAFSGGVDSTYLAWVAVQELGDRVLAVTADSPSYPARHREFAGRVARQIGLRHQVVASTELENPAYRANRPDRCYHCKRQLFERLTELARQQGLAAVIAGDNADDRGDYRPGRQALRELGVRSPLEEVGLTKDEIRALSRRAGLPTWNRPAAACLSSRIPYDTEITVEKLRMIERAEEVLLGLGFRVCRVRHHGDLARVELGGDEMSRAVEPEVAAMIVGGVKAAGFTFVSLDLQGYRTGSLNETLPARSI